MRKLRRFLCGRLFFCLAVALFALAGGIYLAVRLPRLLAPVALVERAFSFVAALTVLFYRGIPETKLAKFALLAFLPWVGAAAVLFFGGEAPSPLPVPPPAQGDLIERAAALSETLCGAGAVTAAPPVYFSDGRAFRNAFLADLARAKHRVYLEFYIVAEGKFWKEISALLREKAQSGADVRLIIDGFGCALTLPRSFRRTLKAQGIKCAVFRPLRLARDAARRDHRKLALIDGVCYTGGINLADEYVAEKIRFGHWKDSAVRLEGDISAFYELFLRTWYMLRPSERLPAPPSFSAGKTRAAIFFDGAGRFERAFLRLFPLLAANATRSLFLFTPYLSLPASLLEALETAALSGTDVRLMIPHIPDKRAVFFLTRAYARELQRRGVKVREYTDGFLHAKTAVVDGRYALVSSCNLDFRSLCSNAECGVLFEGADDAEADFLACWQRGCEVPKANVFSRFFGRVCMLFAPLV